MKTFSYKIKHVVPEHDYPAGLVHPYWARKPLNIVEEIIRHYSKEGDLILDPFMGSGTSLVAAVKNNRNTIGSDLSPISYLLVKGIFDSANSPDHFKSIINQIYRDWSNFAIELYSTIDEKCVERENYKVVGEYVDSNFVLELVDCKVKPIKNGALEGKIEIRKHPSYKFGTHNYQLENPINLSNILFTENTRIAVHKGARASDFFTDRNKAFINYALKYIETSFESDNEKNFVKMFLSSMIPLLRLSDKKASSQWPYWRPKEFLTSRNPIVGLKKRLKAFFDMLSWEEGELSKKGASVHILHCPAIELSEKIQQKVDLIITDPPYADHAPYMEYSDLYWSIISGERTYPLWKSEIVKTNAVGREIDTENYEKRMYGSLCSILSVLKTDGYFVFFYLDKNIYHWDSIKKAIFDSSCILEEVIAIPKQRRSMKAVTNPGKTLDGDLIIVCKKVVDKNIAYPSITMEELLLRIGKGSYFEKYSQFIKEYMQNTVINLDAWSLKDISRIL